MRVLVGTDGRVWAMNVVLGEHIQFTITGHSAINGAVMPEGSTIVITGNNDEVARPPSSVTPIGTGGEMKRTVEVLVQATGSVDWTATVTDPQGVEYTQTDTLVVSPVPEPGIVRIEAKFEPAT